MKKSHVFCLLSLLITNSGYCQTIYKSSDINGLWQGTKPGVEIYINILGSNATITSVAKTSLTPSIIGGNLYEHIQYLGEDSWTAQRNAWKYIGVGGVNSDKGYWQKAEKLTLVLTPDKSTLSASGHWVFRKVDTKISTQNDISPSSPSKTSVSEDFGGVTGNFILANKTSGGSFVVAKLSNNTQDKLAMVLIKTDDNKLVTEYLDPGAILTKKYDSKSLEIQVQYMDKNKPKHDFNVIDFTKGEVRKLIINENKQLKVKKWDPVCMCVRG